MLSPCQLHFKILLLLYMELVFNKVRQSVYLWQACCVESGQNLLRWKFCRAAKDTDSRPKCSVRKCIEQFGVIFGLSTGIFWYNEASFGKL